MSRYERDKERLQKYLPQLRGCAGLSAEALAQKIGTTKQAISYMEKHPEKPMTKMQYICIRTVFEEEYHRNPNNLNLRDCYDMVFSDPDFYDANVSRIEYAMYQAVEDTKIQKRKNRAEAKAKGITTTAGFKAGATIATLAVGGIAATTFPLMFPIVSQAVVNTSVAIITKEKTPRSENKLKGKRASSNITHSAWRCEAFNADHDTIETDAN